MSSRRRDTACAHRTRPMPQSDRRSIAARAPPACRRVQQGRRLRAKSGWRSPKPACRSLTHGGCRNATSEMSNELRVVKKISRCYTKAKRVRWQFVPTPIDDECGRLPRTERARPKERQGREHHTNANTRLKKTTEEKHSVHAN